MRLTEFKLKKIILEELESLISNPPSQVAFDTPHGNITVNVSLATTLNERARGLMFHRDPLGDEHGMLFDALNESDQGFYMKNTFIPLDMIFINDARQVVGIVENAEPHTLTRRSVGAPSRYVLEVDGGWCGRNGIEVGQTAQFWYLLTIYNMHITKQQLRQLIKEELQNVLQEQLTKSKVKPVRPEIRKPLAQRVNDLEEKYTLIASMLGLEPIKPAAEPAVLPPDSDIV